MPRKPSLPCRSCGKLVAPRTGMLPAGQYRCLECRQADPAPNVHEYPDRYALSCEGCGQEFRAQHKWRRFCSIPCANRALHPTYRPASNRQVKRRTLEGSAPGLSARARSRLLARWKRRGERCAYCPALAATVDHVVPLCMGGTNYEGNLAPACRRCNSSKSGLLLVAWRYRRAGVRYAC